MENIYKHMIQNRYMLLHGRLCKRVLSNCFFYRNILRNCCLEIPPQLHWVIFFVHIEEH